MPSKRERTEEKRGITPCIKHGVFVPFSKSVSRSIIIVNLKVNNSYSATAHSTLTLGTIKMLACNEYLYPYFV